MALEPLKIIKRWLTNSRTREEVWDEIADKTVQWAQKTNNNLQQLGLDIDGADYQFNNNGRQTQATPLVDRIALLEAIGNAIGSTNIALDLSTTGTVRLVQSDGSDFSATEPGVITFNSTDSAGKIVSRNITTNLNIALQGCHWGFGGGGDLTDTKLYLLLMDTGSTVIFGIDAKGGRTTVTPADAETVATSVSTIDKVYVTSEPGAEYNCYYIGWVNANFDDTGNPGGEDYWTIQTGVGDINLGRGETQSRNQTVDGNLSVAGAATLSSTLTLGTNSINVEKSLVPLGSIIPWYDFDAALSFDASYWAYCDGSSATITGIDLQTLPDLSGRYLVGFGGATEDAGDIDTATWDTEAVGAELHQIDVSHTHGGTTGSESSHTHTESVGYGNTDISISYPRNGTLSGSESRNVFYWATGGSYTSRTDQYRDHSTGAGSSHSHSISSGGSATQSIQPRSIRVRFIMRIK